MRTITKGKLFNRPSKNRLGLVTRNSATFSGQSSAPQTFQLQPAQVIDIILDQKHKNYNVIQDIGKVFVKRVFINKNEQTFVQAYPINSNIRDYPIIGQSILLIQLPNLQGEVIQSNYSCENLDLFYITKLNLFKNIISNQMQQLSNSVQGVNDNVNQYSKNRINQILQQFKNNKPVRIKQGQLSIQSRFNNTILFGYTSRNHSQLIIVNNSLIDKNKPLKDININDDGSSIHLTRKYQNTLTNIKNINQIPQIQQIIIINSDNIILNTRNNIFINGQTNVNISSGKQININSQNININGRRRINLKSSHIVLQSKNIQNSKQQSGDYAVLSNELIKIMQQILTQITNIQHISPGYGNPTPKPTNSIKFEILKRKLNKIKSKTTKIDR